MIRSNSASGPAGNFDMAALRRAMDSIPKPMTIVTSPYFLPGKAMMMREGDHLYAFMTTSDLEAIPTKAAAMLGMGGVPVKTMEDPEMREVFMRGLQRLADAELARP